MSTQRGVDCDLLCVGAGFFMCSFLHILSGPCSVHVHVEPMIAQMFPERTWRDLVNTRSRDQKK